MLRMWLLNQFSGFTGSILVVVNGVSVSQDIQTFVYSRLGATDDDTWQTIGSFFAIIAGALVISVFAHVMINHTVR